MLTSFCPEGLNMAKKRSAVLKNVSSIGVETIIFSGSMTGVS